MRTRVKICGITQDRDARAAVEAGADALGFVFHRPSARYVDPVAASEIIGSLPPFVDAVGVVVDLPAAELENLARLSGVDYFQFHGDEPPEQCREVGLPFLKALRVRPESDIRAYADRYTEARGLLLDAFVEDLPGGTGDSFDWSWIPHELPVPLFLAGGLDAGNVGAAIHSAQTYGVDVSSGVEHSPGIKDAGKIVRFLESVADADRLQHNTRITSP